MDEPLPTIPAPGAPPPDWSQVSAPAPAPAAYTSFDVGQLLAGSFSVWARSLLPLVPLGLLAHAPIAVGMYLFYSRLGALSAGGLRDVAALLAGVGAVWLLSLLFAAVEFGAVARGALGRLEGRPVGLGEMLTAGVRRAPSVAGVLLLVGLSVIPATLLLVAPALFLLCGWCAAVPAAVGERLGPVRALSRSWALTQGYRWHVFGGFAVLLVAVAMVNYLVQAVALGMVFAVTGLGALRSSDPNAALALPMAVAQLVNGVTSTLTLVATSVAYQGLRRVKEGGDPAVLAQVFE